MSKKLETEKAGYSIGEWCKAIGVCKATLYNLPAKMLPRSVKIGKRRIIMESPGAYLKRVAARAAKEMF